MAANNNTTSLNMGGTIGTRNFQDMTAKGISTEISRHNYQQNVLSDRRLDAIRQSVYKMVTTWSMEDKIAILTEYGDVDRLGKNADSDVVNKQVTESLIIHLDPADLNQLYKDVSVKERKLVNTIKQIEKKHQSPHRFNMGTFEKIFSRVQYLKPDKIGKAIKAYDDSYKINKNIRQKFKTLEKELRDVLSTCFNKIEITGMAFSMGIEIMEGQNFKSICDMIINKVILFVAFVLGNSKANFANAFSDMEPYENLLQYTSYSYVVGRPGMDPNAWAKLKTEARRAKVAMKERAKMQTYKLKAKEAGGGMVANTMGGLAKAIKKKDIGILADAEYEDLLELAGRYGIDPTKKNTYRLKAEIYSAMGQENKRVYTLNKVQDKLKRKGKSTRGVDDLLSIHSDFINGKTSSAEGGESSTPIVHFNARGEITESTVLAAVPVWIIGQGLPGRSKLDKITASEVLTGGAINMRMNKNIINAPDDKKDLPEILYDEYTRLSKLEDTAIISEINNIPHVNQSLVTTITNTYDSGGADILHNAYIWALCRMRPKFKRIGYFLEKKYHFRKLKFFEGGGVKRMFAAIGRGLVKPVKAIARVFKRLFGGVTDLDDLSPKSQELYDQLGKLHGEELWNALYSVTKSNSARTEIEGFISTKCSEASAADKKDIRELLIRAIYAHAKGLGDLKGYYLHLLNSLHRISKRDVEPLFKMISAGFLGIKALGRGLKNFGNSFAKAQEKQLSLDDTDTNENAKLGIPRIQLANNAPVNPVINDAVPVWVVGGTLGSSTPGSDNPAKSTLKAGIGENAEDAAKHRGDNNGDNSIQFTRDGATIVAEMAAKGYTPVSAILSKGKGSAGKKYKLKTADIKWALENGFTFATGGQSFIAGDSLNGSPNPERVTIRGDGSFMVNPVKSGPQNGYSDYALDKYAGGGEGGKKKKKEEFGEKYIDPLLKSVIKGIKMDKKAAPVYVVNKALSGQAISSVTGKLINQISLLGTNLSVKMSEIETALGSFVLAAPFGVGAMTNPAALAYGIAGQIADNITIGLSTAVDEVRTALGFHTGGTSKLKKKKFATGGQSIITGDAAGNNMFKGGAQPELVKSDGDLEVTPLNKANSNTKVSRLSSEDRRNALAVSMASHIVKYAYKLPQDAQDVSNEGEAIKVFSVKPGITDIITVDGNETTLADMVGGMISQLASLTALVSADTELLSKIATKPAAVVNQSSSGNNTTPAGSFPSSIDNILKGE